jgi:hypothetical protein
VTQKQKFLDILEFHFSDLNQFHNHEVYQVAEGPLSFHYPKNNHIKEKIRDLLQELRDDGILAHFPPGLWGWSAADTGTLYSHTTPTLL